MEPVVELEKELPYPAEKVYALWLRPETFAEWFIPGPGVKLGRVELDAHEGGHFLIEMLVDGKILPHQGTYQRLVPFKTIVFSWRSGMTGNEDSLVEASFEARGSATLLRLVHRGLKDAESRQAHQAGWARIVDSLGNYLSEQEQA